MYHCKKCNQEKKSTEFYPDREDKRLSICKECMCNQLDINDTDTFFWILQELDVPFIKHEWDWFVEKYNNASVLGRYLSKMRLKSFKDFRWKDSDELNELYRTR